MVDERDPKSNRPSSGTPTVPMAEAATYPGPETPTEATFVDAGRSSASSVSLPAAGYQLGDLIGKGGMGEVVAAHDQRIGREVAIKRMRTATPDGEQVARFLREARIQARLDHPAIVPVHELGIDEAGRPYFTMKRISGRTFANRLHDPKATQQELLRALIDVCLAIELAHSRGVVHRDLKPANIMLGDFGEVYVLDWGVARVLADATDEQKGDIETLDDGTQTGALLGTPGYMAPEQIKGQAATQSADVYALGAILFEILAGEPLHPRGAEAISSTLQSPTVAPAQRRADRPIPTELDGACYLALAEIPEDRPTARKLADLIQAYLDGDRDVERRRVLAAEQLAAARSALADGSAAGRTTAIRRAGRALALDPESAEAAQLVTSLIVEPPDELPPELIADLAREEKKTTSQRSRAGFYAYLSLYAFWVLFPFVSIISWGWMCALYAVVTLNALIAWRGIKTGEYPILGGLATNLLLAIGWTRVAGPFILTPVLLCGVVLTLSTSSLLIERRWLIIVWTSLAFLLPIGLEEWGILSDSWTVNLTNMTMVSSIFQMEGIIADASLVVANIAFVSTVGLVALRVHRAAKDARRTLHVQNWHMNHLLPTMSGQWATGR